MRRNSDTEIRALERAVETSNSTPDRARLMSALVRAGRVDPLVVKIAAFLGHDAAVHAGVPAATPEELRSGPEERAEARRRRWVLAHNDDTSEDYVRGLEWFEEPHDTGPEEDDGLTEDQRDLVARRRVLEDARRGDLVSIKALLWLRGYPPYTERRLNPEYPLVLLEGDPVTDPGLVGPYLQDLFGGQPMTVAEYRGANVGPAGEWLWRLARPILKRLANDVLLEVMDEALGLPVVSRRENWAAVREKLQLWRNRPRTAWWELVPVKLRKAAGVGPEQVDPATAPDERLELPPYAWPGGYELFYQAEVNHETSIICHRCANRSAEPWTLKRLGTVENVDHGEAPTRCDGVGCERVIVESKRAAEINFGVGETVELPVTPGNPVICDECRNRRDEGVVFVLPGRYPGLYFCDEACAKEYAARDAETDEDAEDEQDPENEGPVQGDLVTDDYREFWVVEGRGRDPVVIVPEDEDWRPRVRAYFEEQRFWPNVWFQSDHGNLSLLSVDEESS